MAAIFLAIRIPPERPIDICKMEAACFSTKAANSYMVDNRSPVAMGMLVERATLAISSIFSGGTGSSNQRGSYFSNLFANRMALEVFVCP